MTASQQNVIFMVFGLTWGAGTLAFVLRELVKQGDYLKRFPPVNGVPLNAWPSSGSYGDEWNRAVFRAQLQPQSDPDLERQRRRIARRWRFVLLWIFGYPFLYFPVAVVVTIFISTVFGKHVSP